jgi:hypothetical protein
MMSPWPLTTPNLSGRSHHGRSETRRTGLRYR